MSQYFLDMETTYRHISGIYCRYRDGGLPCACIYRFELCGDCSVINTCRFYDLDVPLHAAYFRELRTTLVVVHQWGEKCFYDWLCFWMREFYMRMSVHSSRSLVFFEYDRYYRMSRHCFFYYLYDLIVTGAVFSEHGIEYRDGDSALITTGDAMVRLSYEIYRAGGRVTGVRTDFLRKSIIVFTDEEDARQDRYHIYRKHIEISQRRRWKDIFRAVVQQIDEEVRYRPGMCGMQECMSSFLSCCSRLQGHAL